MAKPKSFKSFLKGQDYLSFETIPFPRKKKENLKEAEQLDEKVQRLRPTLKSAIGTAKESNLTKKWSDKHVELQNALHKRLASHYNFNDDDEEHIKHFTDYSAHINKHLNAKAKPKEEAEKSKPDKVDKAAEEEKKLVEAQIERHASGLDKMLSQHVSPSADFHVYTGLKRSPRDLHKEHTGEEHDGKSDFHGIFHHFASTSTDPAVAKEFARSAVARRAIYDGNRDNTDAHIIKFKIPAKSKHGAYIAEHSEYPSENEFLLRRNKKFKIHPEPEEHHYEKDDPRTGKTTKHKLYIWHGELEG